MAALKPHSCAQLFPLMDGDEFAALKADIAEHGQRESITLHEGKILDGRNRYRACRELGIEPDTRELPKRQGPAAFVISANLHRRHLSASQKSAVAVELEAWYAKEAKQRQKEHGGTAPGRKKNTSGTNAGSDAGEARVEAAKIVGVNPRYVSDAKAIKKADPELFDKVASGEVTLPQARTEIRKRNVAKAAPAIYHPESECVGTLGELTGRKFGCIYADPPWNYNNQKTRASTDRHYKTLSVDDLCAMPVESLAADDAHIHLWTTNAFLPHAFRVIEAWGFEYRSVFVWVKPQMGIGNYWRVSHEFLLLGIRGDSKRFNNRSLMSWGQFDRGEHSSKPEAVRGFIEMASPGPYLEMFGRETAEGWTTFGNQINPQRKLA